MKWEVKYLPEALEDLKGLAGNQRLLVSKAIRKVAQNPLPMSEGGYGKPLGNHGGNHLSGLMKIKLRDDGLRIVYALMRIEGNMVVVVIGAREDDEVYEAAQKRLNGRELNP